MAVTSRPVGTFDHDGSEREVVCRTVRFYADRDSLIEILKRLAGKGSHRYVLSEMSPLPQLVVRETPEDLVGDGLAKSRGCLEHGYWAVAPNDPFAIREIPQRNGGYRYLFDHLPSTKPIMVHPGGRYGDEMLIETHLVGYDAEAALSRVRRYLKANFLKVGPDWVSPQAEAWRREGLRLNDGIGRQPWSDVMDDDQRYAALRPMLGTELDRLFYFSDFCRDYEKRRSIDRQEGE